LKKKGNTISLSSL